MTKKKPAISSVTSSFWKVFRLVFVFFSLYLMGDAFFRWDGFRYYASLYEFLTSLALASIIWTILAFITALTVMIAVKSLEKIASAGNRKIFAEHFVLFICFLTLAGKAVWEIKLFFLGPGSSFTFKILSLLIVILLSAVLTWVLRNKYDMIQERITPLVMLFGLFIIISVPLVAYQTWIRKPERLVSPEAHQVSPGVKKRPNIIMVTYDALSAFNMSTYGYHRETTPFITEWSKNATLFTSAISASSSTAQTTSTLMTGKRLWTHQRYTLVHANKIIRSTTEHIPLLLKQYGYYNMAFVANRNASIYGMGISDSFDVKPRWTELNAPASASEYMKVWLHNIFGADIRIYDWIVMEDFILYDILKSIPLSKADLPAPPEMAFNMFLTEIDNHPPKPFFAWIHLFPPHHPYISPNTFNGMFDSTPIGRSRKEVFDMINKVRTDLKTNPEISPATQKYLDIGKARYDETIRYSDNRFENFIDQLKKRGLHDSSLIILSADHGEGFEHHFQGHTGEIYEPIVRIPLVIKEPFQSKGLIIEPPVDQINIPITILDIADIPSPSWTEGRSLIPLIRGDEFEITPVFSMVLFENKIMHPIIKGKIAIWDGDYKYVHYLDENKSFLFNFVNDPDELNNIINDKPEIGAHLDDIIRVNLDKANERILLEGDAF